MRHSKFLKKQIMSSVKVEENIYVYTNFIFKTIIYSTSTTDNETKTCGNKVYWVLNVN